jgi:hypothetical protein
MKKASTPEREQDRTADLRPEYTFDYRRAKPNRFAGRVDKSQVVVMLDSDISEVFRTPESVNTILRALIKTMPKARARPDRKSPSESAQEAVPQ